MIPLNLSTLHLWNVSLNIVRDLPLPLPLSIGVEEKNADVMGVWCWLQTIR